MDLKTQALTLINARIRLEPKDSHCGIVFSHDKDPSAGYDCMGTVPLKLGMNVLQKLHLYLATKEKMLYFTGPESAPSGSQVPSAQPAEK